MLKSNKLVFFNTASYYIINFSDYFISLIILPFLARTITIEGIGVLGIANTLGIVCLLLMEYGFSLSATRDIASKNSYRNINFVASRVLLIRSMLIIPCVLICLLSFFFLPIFSKYPLVVIFTFLTSLLNGFTPVWYFQGIQKVFPFAMLKVSTRVVFLIPIFLFVRTYNDVWLVLLFQSISSFIVCSVSLFWLFKNIKFEIISFNEIKNSLKDGWHTFSLTIVPPICLMLSFYWLSTKFSLESIGLINTAERIFRASISIFGPIGQAIYPFIISQLSKDRLIASRQTKKAFWLYLIFSMLATIAIIFFAKPFIIWYLGNSFFESAKLLQVFAISLPVIQVSYILGRQWMLSVKLDKVVNTGVITSNLILLISLIYFNDIYHIFSLPFSILLSETALLIFYFIYLTYNRLGFWNIEPKGLK